VLPELRFRRRATIWPYQSAPQIGLYGAAYVGRLLTWRWTLYLTKLDPTTAHIAPDSLLFLKELIQLFPGDVCRRRHHKVVIDLVANAV
jgi:hypothetical protein